MYNEWKLKPTTSAVLKPRHNQLDHPCDVSSKIIEVTEYHTISATTKGEHYLNSILSNLGSKKRVKYYTKGELNPRPQPCEGRVITN